MSMLSKMARYAVHQFCLFFCKRKVAKFSPPQSPQKMALENVVILFCLHFVESLRLQLSDKHSNYSLLTLPMFNSLSTMFHGPRNHVLTTLISFNLSNKTICFTLLVA